MKEFETFVIFQDLDGCLADFDKRVKELTGGIPSEIKPGVLWKAAATDREGGGFFANLDWMPDGKELWDFVKPYDPQILTGCPNGKWGPEQKRVWCARELGPDVIVHTVMSRDKWEKARDAIDNNVLPVLIDDTPKLKDAWEEIGGMFILHTSTTNTIAELKERLLND